MLDIGVFLLEEVCNWGVEVGDIIVFYIIMI